MLYGIRKIEYCNAANLAFSDIFSQYVDTCTPTNQFTELCIVQQKATLKVESDIENKQVIYRAELQFDTEAESGLERGNLAFKVTTVNGEQFLIGSPTRPRVVVTTAHNVAESASGQSGYTTVCKFTAIYKPKTIPNTAEPVSDLRQFDICCGQIKTGEPVSGPAYDVCCGEIVGKEPTYEKTVVWIDYDRTPLDHKTYNSDQPEPTTSVVPTRQPTSEYTYTFAGWSLISQTDTLKVYQATYTEEPILQTITVIWQTDTGEEIERKTYTEGQPEPQPSTTPANRRYNELFGYKFNGWSLYSETEDTKIYRATYVNAIYDWSTVEPTGEQSSALDNTGGNLGTTFEPVNSPASVKCWVFWSFDGTTINKSPFYRTAWQSVIFNWGNIPCMVFIFIYNNSVDITESGLPPGTIESGVRGQWYALGTQGNYKVYGWRTADWTGFAPANGQFMPIS